MNQIKSEKQKFVSNFNLNKSDIPIFLNNTPFETDFIFFDLETTGGNAQNGKIIEIAALKYSSGKKVDEFYSLVNPQRSIPKFVQSITGIKNSDVINQPIFKDLSFKFLDFIKGCVLCSHGVLSDYSFLKQELIESTHVSIDNYYICTHLIVSNFFKDIPSKSLSGVANYFGLVNFKAHRAMADAEKTSEVFWEIYAILKEKGFKVIKDIIKLQADNSSLSRLGVNLDKKLLEKIPTTPGLFYFYNENRELSYISASRNPKKTLLGLSQSKDEKEILRLLAESHSFHFKRSSHFLEALIQESKELSKNNLPIDPRRIDYRNSDFIQVLFPLNNSDEFIKIIQSLEDTLPNLKSLLIILTDLKKSKQNKKLPNDLQNNLYQPQSIQENLYLKNLINEKHTRKVFQGYSSTKHKLVRFNTHNDFKIKNGHLSEGFGWFSKPEIDPRKVTNFTEYLSDLFPLCQDLLQSFFNLSTLLSIMYNKTEEQKIILKNICLNPKFIFKPSLIMCAFNSLRSLQTYLKSEFSHVLFEPPKDGLAVINNNNEKNLEIYIVIKGAIKKIKKISVDDSIKLSSSRFFTRLFLPFKFYVLNQEVPIVFENETCDYIELLQCWIDQNLNEGEWVDFKNLMPLFQPEVLS